MKNAAPVKMVAVNRKAHHDYDILETLEVGIALVGTEIKSIREGKVDLRDSFAKGEGDQIWLFHSRIAPYSAGNRYNHPPDRPRRLLLHKRQIGQLLGKVAQKSLTLIPLKLYLKGHLAKVELALARGRKLYDRKEAIARRDAEREAERAMAGRRGGRVRVR